MPERTSISPFSIPDCPLQGRRGAEPIPVTLDTRQGIIQDGAATLKEHEFSLFSEVVSRKRSIFSFIPSAFPKGHVHLFRCWILIHSFDFHSSYVAVGMMKSFGLFMLVYYFFKQSGKLILVPRFNFFFALFELCILFLCFWLYGENFLYQA